MPEVELNPVWEYESPKLIQIFAAAAAVAANGRRIDGNIAMSLPAIFAGPLYLCHLFGGRRLTLWGDRGLTVSRPNKPTQ